MNILIKLISLIKNMFHREDIKMLEETTITDISKRDYLIKSLKISDNKTKIKPKNIITLICYGNGLGIQKKIKY